MYFCKLIHLKEDFVDFVDFVECIVVAFISDFVMK